MKLIIKNSHLKKYKSHFLTIYDAYIFNLRSFQGRRCVLKDCCYIEDNSILPPETVVPTFTRYSGSPAKRIGELPENTQDIMVDFTKNYYNHFTATSAPISGVAISSSVRPSA